MITDVESIKKLKLIISNHNKKILIPRIYKPNNSPYFLL